MKPCAKAGIVLAGYACALVLAVAVAAARIRGYANNPDAQASSGMYAFGDALVFIFTFGVTALVPTGLALYFARPGQWFWKSFVAGAALLAATNVFAALVYWADHLWPHVAWLGTASALAVLRMIVAPLVAAAIFVCAEFASGPRTRRMLRIAGVCEILAAAPWMLWLAMHAFGAH